MTEKVKVFKKQDVITIGLITVSGIVAAYFATNFLLGDPANAKASFKMIDEISATVAMPDPEVFNLDAINPTVEVYVGSCEDVDQNGILSAAELSACGEAQIEEEEEEEEDTTKVRCPDGELVDNAEQCPAKRDEDDEED